MDDYKTKLLLANKELALALLSEYEWQCMMKERGYTEENRSKEMLDNFERIFKLYNQPVYVSRSN